MNEVKKEKPIEAMTYQEWIKSLHLDIDNSLTEKEYLKKRDQTKKHKKEVTYHSEISHLTESSILRNIKKATASVDVLIAIALSELKNKDLETYKTLNVKEIANEQ